MTSPQPASDALRGLVVAAPGSGSGKTTVALALMAALRRRGRVVAPFKVGPDFIDPGHHAAACGRASRNLDGWMLDCETNRGIFGHGASVADTAVVEGVMGLFDGYDGRSEAGSTAQMAKWLDLPVLLVVDARSMARSAAALVQGFERFDPGLRFAGVLFNRVGSPRHLAYLREALAGHVRMPCLGGLARNEDLRMPERHLGLVTAEDHPLDESALARLADWFEAGCACDTLLEGLAPMPTLAPASPDTAPDTEKRGGRARIGVARDRAFCFYYPENLELLERQGAELVFFSPLEANALPRGLDGIYLGGGYPELHAAALAANASLRDQMARSSRDGMPIYGECGGFMYLCRALEDGDGVRHPMTGCFPFVARMAPRLRSLGYREVRLVRDTLLGRVGSILRGHEFHYSELAAVEPDVPTAYRVAGRGGGAEQSEGYRVDNTLGSYLHLHWGSRPEAAADFVAACAAWRRERRSP